MKRRDSTFLALALATTALGSAACHKDVRPNRTSGAIGFQTISVGAQKGKMTIRIGSKTFTATLEDTPAGKGFKAVMPLTLKMADLNRNEKHADMAGPLPNDERSPGSIQTGDLLLYGDRTVVLFYKSFETSYSYTRLGRIDNPEGLAAAVGAGSVSVSFDGG